MVLGVWALTEQGHEQGAQKVGCIPNEMGPNGDAIKTDGRTRPRRREAELETEELQRQRQKGEPEAADWLSNQ